MKRDPKLIALLEEEARVLRNHISELESGAFLGGVTTGESDPETNTRLEADNKARLAEVEDHLRALKRDDS